LCLFNSWKKGAAIFLQDGKERKTLSCCGRKKRGKRKGGEETSSDHGQAIILPRRKEEKKKAGHFSPRKKGKVIHFKTIIAQRRLLNFFP